MNLVALTHEIYLYLSWIITNHHGSIPLRKEKLKAHTILSKGPHGQVRKKEKNELSYHLR